MSASHHPPPSPPHGAQGAGKPCPSLGGQEAPLPHTGKVKVAAWQAARGIQAGRKRPGQALQGKALALQQEDASPTPGPPFTEKEHGWEACWGAVSAVTPSPSRPRQPAPRGAPADPGQSS